MYADVERKQILAMRLVTSLAKRRALARDLRGQGNGSIIFYALSAGTEGSLPQHMGTIGVVGIPGFRETIRLQPDAAGGYSLETWTRRVRPWFNA